MPSHRLLTLGPDNEPLWVRLHVYQVEERWTAVIVADGVPPPEPDEVKGLGFYADTPEQAERLAKTYVGMSEPAN